jgi:hypothetical protein
MPYARSVLGWAAAYATGVVPVELPPLTAPTPPFDRNVAFAGPLNDLIIELARKPFLRAVITPDGLDAVHTGRRRLLRR